MNPQWIFHRTPKYIAFISHAKSTGLFTPPDLIHKAMDTAK
jgi:hypothetical protein